MLRRLLLGLLPLLAAFAVVLSVPIGGILADRATQQMYLDRLADADRFATLADRALGGGPSAWMADELSRYHEVYGIEAWLLRVDGQAVLSADGTQPPAWVRDDPNVDLAERGVRPDPPYAVTPGGPATMLVAVPVRSGSEAIGVIVTLSSTTRLRQEVMVRWVDLAGAAGAVTLILAAATVPFSRWLLRPVASLDEAAGRLAAGQLESRAGLKAGPPELRRLAASFDRMADVVTRTLQRQQQFVGDASHQLRTPLTTLRLAVDNLRATLPEGEPGRAARAELDDARSEVQAMTRLLDGLLALTRLGNEPGEPENVDEVLASAVPAWEHRCAAAGMQLHVSAADGLRTASPPGGVRHLLDELVDNAVRLSGGHRVEVSARAGTTPGGEPAVVLAVTDDGRGLNPGQRVQATRRFWRAPEQQNVTGSGLGLAIVAELTASVGGSLALQDATPGLRVEITVPVAPAGR
ncbi:MAG TPA: HAMP domain-containing sensor histidine kinase [Kineosporiaceae bacterium]|nr:HAMP domain-containing sensor histidine kinase [Kineosporiaceae bacterium]